MSAFRRLALLSAAVCAIVIGGALAATPPASAATSAALTPINPARLADTRSGQQTVDGQGLGGGPIAGGGTYELAVTARAGVAQNATAVMLNVTAIRPVAAGFLTVYPCGSARPVTSSVNYQAGGVFPNAVLAKVGAGGKVCVFTTQTTNLAVDVNGFVPAEGTPVPIDPRRAVDTRAGQPTADGQQSGGGAVPKDGTVAVNVAGRLGIPSDAAAVIMNVTAVGPAAAGFLTVYPCGTQAPLASSVNYKGGDVVPNAVIAKIGSGGTVCVKSTQTTNLVIDFNGYVAADGPLSPIEPARFVDTRVGQKTVDGLEQSLGTVVGGTTYRASIVGRNKVPAGTTAVLVNLTAIRPAADGYLTVYPCGTPRPNTSNVNYTAGSVTPNAVLAKIGDAGTICVYSTQTTNFAVDVNAYVRPLDVTDPSVSTTSTTSSTTPKLPTSSTSSPTGPTSPTIAAPTPTCAGVAKLPASECQALVALYNSTAGPRWFAQWRADLGWDSTDPCGWSGVTCDETGTHVGALSFPTADLSGPIPAEISGLTELAIFDAVGHHITGIPPTIGGLAKLQKLSLGSNLITELPPEIGSLASLDVLNLSGNQITVLPPEIGKLSKLTRLLINDNRLTGLPPEIGDLALLDVLVAHHNQLTSVPPEIGNLQALFYVPDEATDDPIRAALDLSYNQLTTVPTEIGLLANINTVDLSYNQITYLPTGFSNMVGLEVLRLNNNQLTLVPPQLAGLDGALAALYIDNNPMSGDVTLAFEPLFASEILTTLKMTSSSGCLSTTDPALGAWLTSLDPTWNSGC